jgi:hypothetical protein
VTEKLNARKSDRQDNDVDAVYFMTVFQVTWLRMIG